MLPKEIKFEEIRKGDMVVERAHIKGVSRDRMGTADHLSDSGVWRTKDGGDIASPHEPRTYRLLDRPVPPLPTEPGTVFRATEIRGVECNAIAFVREHGSEPTSRVYVTATLVNGFASHLAREITAWEPIEGATK